MATSHLKCILKQNQNPFFFSFLCFVSFWFVFVPCCVCVIQTKGVK